MPETPLIRFLLGFYFLKVITIISCKYFCPSMYFVSNSDSLGSYFPSQYSLHLQWLRKTTKFKQLREELHPWDTKKLPK